MTTPVRPAKPNVATAKRYPRGPITRHGAIALLQGKIPNVYLAAPDESIFFNLMGGRSFTDPVMRPEAVHIAKDGLKGLVPPWRTIDQKGATQDGVTFIDALYEPTEVTMTLWASARDETHLREVVRDLTGSLDAHQTSVLSWFTPEMGRWWADLRWFKTLPDPMSGTRRKKQKLTIVMRADDSFWRSRENVAAFRFGYEDMVDEFNVEYSDDCGPRWPQRYTGSGVGFQHVENGQARWQDDPDRVFFTGSRRVIAGPYKDYVAAADDVEVSFQVDNQPEFTVGRGNGAANDAWARMGRNPDGSWDGSGIRARVGQGFVRLSVFKSFREVWHRQEMELFGMIAGELWTLRCTGRTYRLIRTNFAGDFTTISGTESGSNLSFMDADHRGVGFGMQAGGALITQATPARVRQVMVDGVTLDTFDVVHTTNLGPDWPLRYSGANDAYVRTSGGEARWIDNAGTNTQEVVTGPYRDFETATNNQVVNLRVGSFHEVSLGAGAQVHIWARMGRNPDGSWNGYGVRANIGTTGVELSRFNNFVESRMDFKHAIGPRPSEWFTLIAGGEGNERRFVVKRNGLTLMTHQEAPNGLSPLGPDFRGVGFGQRAAGAMITQTTPASVGKFTAADNTTVSQSGFLRRCNVGDQKMYDDYIVFGPGKVKIYMGPGATDYVEFGPLTQNQIIYIATDPRRRAVVDLTYIPPTPQEQALFDKALAEYLDYATANNNLPPLLEQVESVFGVQMQQGNVYSLLKGRFSDESAIPAKSPGRPAKPYFVKVEIDDGNANSQIIATGVPLRRLPF